MSTKYEIINYKCTAKDRKGRTMNVKKTNKTRIRYTSWKAREKRYKSVGEKIPKWRKKCCVVPQHLNWKPPAEKQWPATKKKRFNFFTMTHNNHLSINLSPNLLLWKVRNWWNGTYDGRCGTPEPWKVSSNKNAFNFFVFPSKSTLKFSDQSINLYYPQKT